MIKFGVGQSMFSLNESKNKWNVTGIEVNVMKVDSSASTLKRNQLRIDSCEVNYNVLITITRKKIDQRFVRVVARACPLKQKA